MADNTRDEDVLIALAQHAIKIDELKTAQTELKTEHNMRITILERILLLGDGDRKPLIQTMRDLEKQLSEFIAARTKKDEADADNKKFIRRAWITASISFTLTVILPFLIQFIIFWTRIVPLINKAP